MTITVLNIKISGLVKKTEYDTKIDEIEKKNNDHDHNNKDMKKQKFNKLPAGIFAARLKKVGIADS